jgi:hypothetical protein
MMNQRFREATESIPALFERLNTSTPLAKRGTADQRNRPGIYVFFEGSKPVHVGRTRNLQGRLRGHVTKSHFSASFAFKRARQVLGRGATYRTEGSRSSLAKDQAFMPEFHRQIELVKGMEVRFLEVADPISQYLLELYAHMEYGLPLDEFETH